MYQLKKKINSQYLIIFFLIIIYSLASYNNLGFYNDDEHFQILEPVAYLLGFNDILINDYSDYYWEWVDDHRIRPWIQPNFYYFIIISLNYFGLNDPFIWVYSIRIFNSILGIFSILYLFNSLKNIFFKNNSIQIYFIYFSFWFFPFLHIRTSSESLSITLFCIALAFLIKTFGTTNEKGSKLKIIFFGFILGLSIVVRPQMIFTIFPIFIWVIFFRFYFDKILLVSIGLSSAIFFGLYVDYLNWGEFANIYYKIFQLQILEGRMSGFGSQPWWYYILTILKDLAPIFSLVFLVSLIYFIYKNPKNIFTWMILGTLIILSFFSHKETRFIFPIYIFAPFFIIYLIDNISNLRLKRFTAYSSLIFNFIFLFIIMFFPINSKIALYKFLYYQENQNQNIKFIGENPYQFNNMEPFFYTHFLPKLKESESLNSINKTLVITNEYDLQKKIDNNGNCKIIYSTYPMKIIELNSNWKNKKMNWYVNKCN